MGKPPGGLVNTQEAGHGPEILTSGTWGGGKVGEPENLHFPKFQVMFMLLGQGLQFENHYCKVFRKLKTGGQLYCNVSWGLKLLPVLTSDIDVPGLCYNCHDNEWGSSCCNCCDNEWGPPVITAIIMRWGPPFHLVFAVLVLSVQISPLCNDTV